MADTVTVEWSIDAPALGETVWMAPLHRHLHDAESWEVLEGRLTVRLGSRTVTVGPGETVVARAGVAHTFGNPGPGDCRYRLVMTPRIASLIDALHARSGDDVSAVFAAHDSELLG